MNKKLVLSVLVFLVVGMTATIGQQRQVQIKRLPAGADKQEVSSDAPSDYEAARFIMGRNFFGIEEAIEHFGVLGVNPSTEQRDALKEIPYSEEVLRASRDTHILVAVFPISIVDMLDTDQIYGSQWYRGINLGLNKGEVGWYLVRKAPIVGSINQTYEAQKALLGQEQIPPTRVLVYTIIGHYLNTGDALFPNYYVRTADVDNDQNIVVIVGRFRPEVGLDIKRSRQDSEDHLTGVAGFLPPNTAQ